MKQMRQPVPEKKSVLMSEHRIIMEGIRNIRDMNRYMNTSGRKIADGRLIRSGSLDNASVNDLRMLYDTYKVRFVIDFRSARETAEHPDPAVFRSKYYNLPVLPSDDADNSMLRAGETGMYAAMMFGNTGKQAYKRFFELLADTGGETVLFHDSAGKDETGVAAALLLSLLDFPEDLIIDEYMLSGRGLSGEDTRFDVFPHPLEYALMRAKVEYGSIVSYIKKELSVTPQDIQHLKKLFLV